MFTLYIKYNGLVQCPLCKKVLMLNVRERKKFSVQKGIRGDITAVVSLSVSLILVKLPCFFLFISQVLCSDHFNESDYKFHYFFSVSRTLTSLFTLLVLVFIEQL